ncbi:major facilitator superfamily domain-containing protein [Aspergillus cavernicola]|uniref:Major facilitator superfamily domain-containing protein n=1 Tax=Aspergillus cavernicola TaxID=176166 RepID=A0ABR4HIQ1_9EURO
MGHSQVAVRADSDPELNNNEPVQKPLSRLTRWYRSALFNVIIVGLISFTQPGIWNALNNTGAGGQQKPYLVNGANSLTFGIMVFGCPLFSILANRYGLRRILILGTLGYAPYSASLYTNNRYGTEWFVLFGGVTCGVAASALWSSEGAIALGYGSVGDRGKYTGIWLGLRELGQLIGSSIQLSLNVEDGQRGKVGYTTYLILIGLQCLGLPLAFLISHPSKVIRADGSRIPDPTRQKATLGEFHKLWAQVKKKHILLLIPILVGFNWNGTYQGIYLTNYFSVRARTLGSLTSGIAATAANIFWGWFFDRKQFSRPISSAYNLKLYEDTQPTIDWAQPNFGRGFAVNVIFRFMNESHYMFVYWLLGVFNDDLETLTLTVGIVRCFESVGSCLAFGIGAAEVPPMVNLIVAFVMFVLCIPTTSWVVFMVPEHPESTPKDGVSSQESVICFHDTDRHSATCPTVAIH